MSATNSAVAGGHTNTAADSGCFIGSGKFNSAAARYAFVGGGYGDSAANPYSTVAGGQHNVAVHSYATAVGGADNRASGDENEEYGPELVVRFGPIETFPHRYHESMLRVLQMRRNLVWAESGSWLIPFNFSGFFPGQYSRFFWFYSDDLDC